ncbi:MAG: hypothetical protein ACYCYI_07405 [Saccharofermentanales bacterium]
MKTKGKTMRKTVLSIFISIFIVLSALVFCFALFLQNTIFSVSFYQKVTASPEYVLMLKQAISHDLAAQSSYVAIPVEVLNNGLDDRQIEISLRFHIENTVRFLDFQGEYVKAGYPEDLFFKPLDSFIQSDGEQNGYKPSEEQYVLLHQVAADSSGIAMKHINLLNMDMVKDRSEFKWIHRIVFQISKMALPGLFVLIIALTLLAFIQRRHLKQAVLYAFSSFWITGALLFIPPFVLTFFGLMRRLAIQTAYLKYAVDSWLTISNAFLLFLGLGVLVSSTCVLIIRIMYNRPKHKHHRGKRRYIIFSSIVSFLKI